VYKPLRLSFDDLLGKSATLAIRRFGAAGAFLAELIDSPGPEDPTILLLGSEIPEGAREGDQVRVFIHLDSEDRPIATTRKPKLELFEVAFLTVTARTSFGAFFDWGLAKELLVPLAEQTTELVVGGRQPIGLYVDDTGRLAGTMKIAEMLDHDEPSFVRDAFVQGEAWRNDPDIGLFVIVERRWVGLVPVSEPHTLSRGQAARFRVTHVHSDGRIELSLRRRAHEELDDDAERILRRLSAASPPRIGDHSDPDEIREQFGLSKKAFKRAAGRLFKRGDVEIDPDGYVSLKKR
jgi:predicted RNA-binding protein (virulence factor B family)